MHYELCELLCPCSACPKNPRGQASGEKRIYGCRCQDDPFLNLLFYAFLVVSQGNLRQRRRDGLGRVPRGCRLPQGSPVFRDRW